MNDEEKARQKRRQEIVDRVYAGALNPALYDLVFKSWDDHLEGAMLLGDKPEDIDIDWADEFVAHFERAGEMFDRMEPARQNAPDNDIDTMPYAALLCRADGRVVCANAHAQPWISEANAQTISDLPLDKKSRQRLEAFLAKPGKKARELLRIQPASQPEPQIVLGEWVDLGTFLPDEKGDGLLLKSVAAVWTPEVVKTLSEAFGLSQAEIRLVRNLYKGLSIKEISEYTGKSQPTLRTQLSSVLHKTDAKNQATLARLIGSLIHTIVQKPRQIASDGLAKTLTDPKHQKRKTLDLSNGLSVEIVLSGDLQGQPVYFIQPSSSPLLTKRLIRALVRRGVYVISPVRPGCGETTITPLRFGIDDWADIHLEIIDALGLDSFVCGGNVMGGIYALALARRAPSRCKGVLLLSTGAPLASARWIYAMPPSSRRLFVAARFFPRTIATPIKYVAADFKSSKEGQARAIEYFYESSPLDSELVKTEPEYWNQTRENMNYSFNNIPQLARDIAIWAANHTKLYRDVVAQTPIRFLHGHEDSLMDARHIRAFCQNHPKAEARIIRGRAQLLFYTEPEIVAGELARLADMID